MGFEQFVLSNEPAIRMGFFVGVFALIALWELVAPQFGFYLPWCDRLFGTCRETPCTGQEGMSNGIQCHTDPRKVARLDGMLLMPFRGEVEGYAINRRTWPGRKVP